MAGKNNDIRSLKDWDEYLRNVQRSTPVNLSETELEKKKRIAALEADNEAWYKYYFPAFAYSEPMEFHKAGSRRVIDNPEWYEVRAWSRELAKSTRTMFDIFYLAFVGHPSPLSIHGEGQGVRHGERQRKRNIIMVSNSENNAERLLAPYRAQLESNNRLIHDYGEQRSIGDWEATEFITRTGIAFRAIGAGQSPRGSRNQEIRPDCLLIDDMDTDQDCRNPDIIKDRWKWVEEALMPTRSISKATTVIFCGNIIAKDCCILRACKVADKVDIVNIRMPDATGTLRSSWPTKNTEEAIDRVLANISYSSAQKEYFNNPINEGTIFKKVNYKPALSLDAYSMLCCYTDPSYKASGDFKGTVLVGRYKDEYHVIKAFCAQTTIAEMVDWHYQIMDIVGQHLCYYYMEQVFMQDLFYTEFTKEAVRRGRNVPISGDTRAKPEKFARIEALLEPLMRNGKLYFNEAEKEHPGMMALEDQFIAFEPGSRAHDDGPDAVEGAIWMLNNKAAIKATGTITINRRKPNSKRV